MTMENYTALSDFKPPLADKNKAQFLKLDNYGKISEKKYQWSKLWSTKNFS